jgi:predicted DNA-binding transcriptional regulator YafY
LEGAPGRSLQELVDNLADDYPKSVRTVRRDLEALEAVGIPLVVEKRNGVTRWRLMEAFRDIPALGFSATELMALLLSRNLLKPPKAPRSKLRLTPRSAKQRPHCRPRDTNIFGRWSRCFPSASARTRIIANIDRPSI